MSTTLQKISSVAKETGGDGELPEGWATASLGYVCSKITDGTHKTPDYVGDGVRFLSTANLVPFKGGFDFSEYERFISQAAHRELTKRCQPEEGDVLISKCGTIGRTKEIDVKYPFSIFVGLALLKPLHGLFAPRFLECFLNSPDIQSQFEELAPGSTRRTLTLAGINRVELSIPPLAEQKRIVSKVENLLAQVNASCDRLAKVELILNRFRQAILAAACSGRLTEGWRALRGNSLGEIPPDLIDHDASVDVLPPGTNLPDSWMLSTLGKLVEGIEAGRNIRCEERPPRRGEKGIVKISSVTWGEFDEEESKTLTDASLFMPQRRIRSGDLLISRANTIDLVGACVIVRSVSKELMLSDKVLRLRMDRALSSWVLFLLRSSLGRHQIENLATGNQLSMRNISQESLQRVTIPLPPPIERMEVVRRVEALFEVADNIETRIAAATRRAEKLSQAILAKAFRGELVPTEAELARREDRDYEPASALLVRIRAERAMKEVEPTTRRSSSARRAGRRYVHR
jgi:type I restriction enzyme S subunit